MKNNEDSYFLSFIVLICFAVVLLANVGVEFSNVKAKEKDSYDVAYLNDEIPESIVIISPDDISTFVEGGKRVLDNANKEVRSMYRAFVTKEIQEGEDVISGDKEISQRVDEIEEQTQNNIKMGAKVFLQRIIDGSFIKEAINAKEIVDDFNTNYEKTELYEKEIETQNIIIDEYESGNDEKIDIEVGADNITLSGEENQEQETNINGIPTNYIKTIDVTATAYCLCQKCCGKSPSSPNYGRTASGLVIVPNTGMKVLAVDPKVISLGTNVYVEGLNGAADYGYAVAADTGGAIKGNKVDLYFDTHQEALRWGRRTVRVYILPD